MALVFTYCLHVGKNHHTLTFRLLMSYIYIYSILDVSRSHTTTHYGRYDSSRQVISSSQRSLPDNTRHSQQTNIHAPGGYSVSKLVLFSFMFLNWVSVFSLGSSLWWRNVLLRTNILQCQGCYQCENMTVDDICFIKLLFKTHRTMDRTGTGDWNENKWIMRSRVSCFILSSSYFKSLN